jgi:hypothetical protein
MKEGRQGHTCCNQVITDLTALQPPALHVMTKRCSVGYRSMPQERIRRQGDSPEVTRRCARAMSAHSIFGGTQARSRGAFRECRSSLRAACAAQQPTGTGLRNLARPRRSPLGSPPPTLTPLAHLVLVREIAMRSEDNRASSRPRIPTTTPALSAAKRWAKLRTVRSGSGRGQTEILNHGKMPARRPFSQQCSGADDLPEKTTVHDLGSRQ